MHRAKGEEGSADGLDMPSHCRRRQRWRNKPDKGERLSKATHSLTRPWGTLMHSLWPLHCRRGLCDCCFLSSARKALGKEVREEQRVKRGMAHITEHERGRRGSDDERATACYLLCILVWLRPLRLSGSLARGRGGARTDRPAASFVTEVIKGARSICGALKGENVGKRTGRS